MSKIAFWGLFLCSSISFAHVELDSASTKEKTLRFISIDGGGLFGLFPIVLLEELEARSGEPISSLVDGMMGSSTGGIIAAMLSTPKQQWDLAPKFSAAEIHQTYVENSMKVFNLRAVANAIAFMIGKANWADYPSAAAPFETLLDEKIGHVYMSHTLKRLMITSFNAKSRRIDIFDSQLARQNAAHDLPLKEAVRATTALEFFFDYATIRFNNTKPQKQWMDGGRLGYNDPTGFLCERLSREYPNRKIVVYALGTGFGTSYKTKAYMAGRNPHLEVVRIEPKFEDRKDGYVRQLLTMFARDEAMAENWDVNYLAFMPFANYIAYTEAKALELIQSPQFKRMLADFTG